MSLFNFFLAISFAMVLRAHANEQALLGPHLIEDCNVYSSSGVLISQFPGYQCLFLDDGRLVSMDSKRLMMLNRDRSELWRIVGHFHHLLSWSEDKKYILALSSGFETIDGKKTRVDIIKKIDLTGKVISEVSSKKIFELSKIKWHYMPFTWDIDSSEKAEFEISHFNSFFEIPDLVKKSSLPALRAGHFILNSLRYGAFVLNSDLSEVLYHFQFPNSNGQQVHDVKVTKQGNIIYFNNDHIRDEKNSGPQSSVEIMDPVSQKIVYKFMSSPPEMFYSPFCGTVQEVGSDHLLISHAKAGFFFLNYRTGKVVSSKVISLRRDLQFVGFSMAIRSADLTEFLKKW